MGSQPTPLPLTAITTLLPPGLSSSLSLWNGRLAPSLQSPSTLLSVPKTFLDAMTVREAVFIREQQIPAENEFDVNDARCVHFVCYASSSDADDADDDADADDDDADAEDDDDDDDDEPRPVGTVRIVPFPHAPHPVKGGRYLGDELVNHDELDGETVKALEVAEESGRDRKTSLHDGEETYLKLGRLAVLPEFRGRGVANQLIQKAVEWMREHPQYFCTGVKGDGLKWHGLFCVHAQVSAMNVWKRAGFVIDEEMGRWWEEGIEHVGMWRRVEVKPQV
ncbi:acyl-CoA N-acyltransferase [Sordaria brevicollis]|uniref:Acyl-CoA N-acyltransferase n=1 Tax=Sordaria brevicollis TaxID=83679 RepID=A0AAE0UAT0_SORBR|nr:acyl-CoA N-acyltransferase [Sordaria brevicollis]